MVIVYVLTINCSKTRFVLKKYLIILPPIFRVSMLQFRLCNHKFPIQLLRQRDVPREERLCTLCNSNDVGDEFHYLFKCENAAVKEKRASLLPKYFQHHPNVIKFNEIMNISSKRKMINLSKFIRFILSLFK